LVHSSFYFLIIKILKSKICVETSMSLIKRFFFILYFLEPNFYNLSHFFIPNCPVLKFVFFLLHFYLNPFYFSPPWGGTVVSDFGLYDPERNFKCQFFQILFFKFLTTQGKEDSDTWPAKWRWIFLSLQRIRIFFWATYTATAKGLLDLSMTFRTILFSLFPEVLNSVLLLYNEFFVSFLEWRSIWFSF